jgi:MinD-like ATPase involved in chromosome partitioning or flagellar assembly
MPKENWQQKLKDKLTVEYVTNPHSEWVDLNISSAALVNLTIISDRLLNVSIPERKNRVQTTLHEFDVSSGFMSLYTVKEGDSLKLSRPHTQDNSIVHTWHDLALWAANPQNHQQLTEIAPRIPQTVSFYSFKGGVGRTTALTHVAWILANRGHKVVAVDLDLEAPGLSTAFKLQPQPKNGIVDFFYERAYLPDNVTADIQIGDIFGEVTIADTSGRLFIVPAGILSLDYISKVDDLRATTVSNRGETLWSIFKNDINQQLKPDIILVDSRTGINQWGALSLLEAADRAIVFMFPNEQNQLGIDVLLKSLNSFGKISIDFVFSPVPDMTEIGLAKIKSISQSLNIEREDDTGDDGLESDDDLSELLIVPYLTPIATADQYPVIGLLDYYNRIANTIDDGTQSKSERGEKLISEDRRWQIIESLNFPPLNAADPKQNLNDLFQKTANFGKFLDPSTCLIKGRKGTGKTALYLLLLKHSIIAHRLASGKLDNVTFLSGHGAFDQSRPSRTEFEIVHQSLLAHNGSWEAFWRSYLLIKTYQDRHIGFLSIIKGDKFKVLRDILKSLSKDGWQSEHTQASLRLSIELELKLIIPDALELLNREQQIQEKSLWFLYDDLDEDFPERDGARQLALTGLFQLIQSCDARRLTSIRFKVFLREDIWNRLNFDNKSHFNGRDLILKWSRIDFLRLALRQATQSPDFKALVDRSTPIENIDTANEVNLSRALEPLWGIRRRAGNKAKFVSRWIYERLTDSSGTSFPRSLSDLLEGAKAQELTYQGLTSIQTSTDDRLIRSKSLEIGLEQASAERCEAIEQEYPDLRRFFNALEGLPALLPKEQLQEIWQKTSVYIVPTFEEFVTLLSEIGIAKWREKDERYSFADIYVYGFKMNRKGTR